MFKIIVAYSKQNKGIGYKNKLPWNLPGDLKYFKQITSTSVNEKQNCIIMGKNTWNSLPKKPLKDRINIVLSKTMKESNDCVVLRNVKSVMQYVKKNKKVIDKCFVIGGQSVYEQFLKQNLVEEIYATEINKTYDCDTFFSDVTGFKIKEKKTCNDYDYVKYYYDNKEEQQYLNTLKNILNNGIKRQDRTNIGTLSIFGNQMKFDLSNNTFPLLTTKRTFFKGIVEELLLFLSGKTDTKLLENKGVNIWKDNTSRKFLDNKDLNHYPIGDMGPTYSFNFRHYGAKYVDCNTNYSGLGYDQVLKALDLIKNNPTSRRIVINLWNPLTLNQVALPPCMFFYQFYVDTKNKKLNCHCVLRSSDSFLGLPFNIGTGALITYMFSHLTSLTPGELTITTSDSHIYTNHVEQCLQQIKRIPKPFPKIFIKRNINNIDDFQYQDFELLNYNPHPTIKGKMAV